MIDVQRNTMMKSLLRKSAIKCIIISYRRRKTAIKALEIKKANNNRIRNEPLRSGKIVKKVKPEESLTFSKI